MLLTVDISLPDVEELHKLVTEGVEKGFLTYDEIVSGLEEVELGLLRRRRAQLMGRLGLAVAGRDVVPVAVEDQLDAVVEEVRVEVPRELVGEVVLLHERGDLFVRDVAALERLAEQVTDLFRVPDRGGVGEDGVVFRGQLYPSPRRCRAAIG